MNVSHWEYALKSPLAIGRDMRRRMMMMIHMKFAMVKTMVATKDVFSYSLVHKTKSKLRLLLLSYY